MKWRCISYWKKRCNFQPVIYEGNTFSLHLWCDEGVIRWFFGRCRVFRLHTINPAGLVLLSRWVPWLERVARYYDSEPWGRFRLPNVGHENPPSKWMVIFPGFSEKGSSYSRVLKFRWSILKKAFGRGAISRICLLGLWLKNLSNKFTRDMNEPSGKETCPGDPKRWRSFFL